MAIFYLFITCNPKFNHASQLLALWVHAIWSTKNREPILTPSLKQEVYQVIKDIANDHEIHLDCINGVEDHVHLLIRLRTDQSVADVVKAIKGNSWDYFKDNPEKYVTCQDGFAAFSVSPSHLKRVRGYIYNQVKHHQDKSLSNELNITSRAISNIHLSPFSQEIDTVHLWESVFFTGDKCGPSMGIGVFWQRKSSFVQCRHRNKINTMLKINHLRKQRWYKSILSDIVFCLPNRSGGRTSIFYF